VVLKKDDDSAQQCTINSKDIGYEYWCQ